VAEIRPNHASLTGNQFIWKKYGRCSLNCAGRTEYSRRVFGLARLLYGVDMRCS